MQKRVFLMVLLMVLSTTLNLINSEFEQNPETLEEKQGQFHSQIDSSGWTLSPNSGSHLGGDEITISGSDFSSFFEPPAPPAWQMFTVDSGQVGLYSALAVDSNDKLHIAYFDNGNSNLKYATDSIGSWNQFTIDNQGSLGHYPSIDVDSNDAVHISYLAGLENLKYATNAGGGWSRSVADTGGGSSNHQQGFYSSIKLDSNDRIHISYMGDNLDLKYTTKPYSGSTWSEQRIDWSGIQGEWTSLALDSNEDVFISYVDETWDRLKFADLSRSSSEYETVYTTGSHEIDLGTSMAFDSNDAVHILYHDDENGDLEYAWFDASLGLWQDSLVDTTGDVGQYPSMAIDSQDNLHVAYYDSGNQDLKYGYYDGTWNISTIDTSGGRFPSLALDSNDNIHISYYDDTNENLKRAQKIFPPEQEFLGNVTIEFGTYGNVTATVVDDTEMTFTSPAGPVTGAEVNDIKIWLEDGTSIETQLTFTYDSYDLDEDGYPDASDDCPETSGNSTQDRLGCPDSDGDGYSDSGDLFPDDSTQYGDLDLDGCGDNRYGTNGDHFPSDPTQCTDSDGDGYGDNLSGESPDHFPSDPSQWDDTDGDGLGDNIDGNNPDACPETWGNSTYPVFGCLDSDGDGWADTSDALPFDAGETMDSDGDGVGDNADEFPNNAFESKDSDGDGVGDNSDMFPNDASESMDTDGDGVGDNTDVCEGHNDTIDEDSDQIPDGCDPDVDLGEGGNQGGDDDGNQTSPLEDADGDGVADEFDICEGHDDSIDLDNDLIPDGCDSLIDSDDDGVEDLLDACEGHNDTIDIDGDGIPYGCDDLIDTDGDGVADGVDECANSVGYVEQNGCSPSDEEGLGASTLVIATGGGIGLGSLLLLFGLPNLLGRGKNRDEMPSISWSGAEPMGPPQMQEIGLVSPPLNALGIQKGDGYEWYEWPESSGDWWYRTANTQDQWQHWEQ